MVSASEQRGMVDVRTVVAGVVDPELRVVTIEELGILREVSQDPDTGTVTVTITPTYSGCPAMDVIRADIRHALAGAGHDDADVRTVLRPAWSTDMITSEGRAKLAAAGIAPPPTGRRDGPVPLRLSARCPQCGSPDTEEISRFGSTACKALWRCRACREPFDLVKPL
jgi:ring-1,2-phenylacetyl-CoA epoxidase subunit PaaD